MPGDHHINGIFIASGGPIKKGLKITTFIYDIVPTALALMGLPIPEDMPGRVLEEIMDSQFLKQYPIKK